MSTKENVKWGIDWAIHFAIYFSLIALVLYVIFGSELYGANNTTFFTVIGAYFVGGIASGVVLGLLRPFASSTFRAAIVGFVVSLPISFACGATFLGLTGWSSIEVSGVVLGATMLGPACGVIAYKQFPTNLSDY